ncbi:aminotransferase class I/II-fold pyridoxal phosphate-dependent enzyme [Dactylosporangium sp. NPDC050588]|uniref:aminotransferase class I/II-fold pyridoxal phosphate-dependent enzyme n=1 Tax=Dactylosporangium sp. NPDC050588 TaxID=3157211 RepID=UPI00340C9B2D
MPLPADTDPVDDRRLLYSELDAHDRLGSKLLAEPDRPFVSDWNGEHPFIHHFLGEFADMPVHQLGSLSAYSHMDEDPELSTQIAELHNLKYGEVDVTARQCLPGAGSTSFLTTLLMFQYLKGVREVAYLPPVYYNAAWWMRTLGFSVRRVASDVDFAEEVDLALPTGRSLLWLTDPVWFAGIPVRAGTVDVIADWQNKTGSTVIVDGTFQHMDWHGRRPEMTSRLDPDLTFRLICPTKTLGLHGFRFAYAIVPERHYMDFTELHGRLHGAPGLADRRFAHRAVQVLASDEGALPLMTFAQDRYRRLWSARAVTQAVEPSCGYFLFARPTVPADRFLAMDMSCYGGTGYPGYARINLLNPAAIDCLMDGRDAG